MKTVKSYPFEPKYKRENGLIVLDTDNLPLPKDFSLQETSAVYLPPGEIAGNHKHPRQEVYVCLDDNAELHWLDEIGKVHIEKMANADKPRLFFIPPLIPHAVVNQSSHHITLLGYADDSLDDVEPVEVATLAKKDEKGLSKQEISQTAQLLSKLEPGFLPFDIFHQVTRLAATPIVEVVPLRLGTNGKIEILLLQREADDPIWPGQLHVPGTVIRATDTPGSFSSPLRRVLTKELPGTKASEPQFVKSILHHSGRGMESSQVYWVEIQGEPVNGIFFDANNLPEAIVQSQLDFIPDAIAHFKTHQSV